MPSLDDWDQRMHDTYPLWPLIELAFCVLFGMLAGLALAHVLGWLRVG